MEDNIHALEIVCKHFKRELGDQVIISLRKRINRAHVMNYRLRRKIANLDSMLQIQKSLTKIMRVFVSSLIEQFNHLAKRLETADQDQLP